MPVDEKIAKYQQRMTDKDKRRAVNRIVRALAEHGVTATGAEVETIMWTPHLVIRQIGDQTVYDPSQPLCFSDRESLGPQALLAYRQKYPSGRHGRSGSVSQLSFDSEAELKDVQRPAKASLNG